MGLSENVVYLIFQWIITMFPIKIAMNVGIPYFQTNPYTVIVIKESDIPFGMLSVEREI